VTYQKKDSKQYKRCIIVTAYCDLYKRGKHSIALSQWRRIMTY